MIIVVALSIFAIAQYNEEYDSYPYDYSDYSSYSDESFYSNSDPSLWQSEYIQYEHVDAATIPELTSGQMQYAVTSGKLNDAQYSAITSGQASELITDFSSEQFGRLSQSTVEGLSEADAKDYLSQRMAESDSYSPKNDNEYVLLSKIPSYSLLDTESLKGVDGVTFSSSSSDGSETYAVHTPYGSAILLEPIPMEYTDEGFVVGGVAVTAGTVTVESSSHYVFSEGSLGSVEGADFVASSQSDVFLGKFDDYSKEQKTSGSYVVIDESNGKRDIFMRNSEIGLTDDRTAFVSIDNQENEMSLVTKGAGSLVCDGISCHAEGSLDSFPDWSVNCEDETCQYMQYSEGSVSACSGATGVTGAAIADITGMGVLDWCREQSKPVVNAYSAASGYLSSKLVQAFTQPGDGSELRYDKEFFSSLPTGNLDELVKTGKTTLADGRIVTIPRTGIAQGAATKEIIDREK